jgi:protein TonB
MRSYQPSSDRRRATSLALTILAHLVIALLLWRLAPVLDPPEEPGRSLTVNLLPVGDNQSTATKSAKAPARAAQASRRTAPEPPAAQAQPTEETPVPPPEQTTFPGYLMLSKNDYAASDVGRIPSRRSGGSAGKQLAAADGQGDGDDGETSASAGTGPGGQRLFNAEWYVEPAQSQLSPYLPKEVPLGSWAEIACRTAANYRVEDCVQLGDSRTGSGLARGIREAAWQFRVRPPRINGKAQIGAWVRIRIDFTKVGGG